MKISQALFDALTRETFVNNFFAHLAAQGNAVDEPRSDPEVRHAIWQLAEEASRYAIVTIGGAIMFVQIHWDLGLDCLARMAALRAIAEDSALPERVKVEQMWQLRCAIYDALAGN